MKISEFYKKQRHTISFEFFPPKTPEGEVKLYQTVSDLKKLSPSFVSVTYGALGTTQANTLRIVGEIKEKIGLEVAAHLTCVAHSRDEIGTVLGKLREKGIENIVALRGDPPQGETEFKAPPNGFRYASELVRFIRQHPEFGKVFAMAVAGYPEGHPECRDKRKDLEHLKIKVDEGADGVMTQLFFNNRDYFDFAERCRKIGIKVPIVPGIMPVTHGPQIEKFSRMCGAAIPEKIRQAIARFGDDQNSVMRFGIEYATEQCRDLLRQGAPGLHFYTLNQSLATREIFSNLDLADKA
ncbi:MAG TPA: methylenetetrahydrofolate reductase [NAD(P)H] [Candidatus Omnitrophota bacterium]|nr:methylenetetrahydrofolate reductase [NAD(P)H] [Candidatus Omnitrophota bacterium]HPS36834.1 methylenetetrahydrofolate reductase [NAD(P)H] [Candidatus Omnitrophota bacterium]